LHDIAPGCTKTLIVSIQYVYSLVDRCIMLHSIAPKSRAKYHLFDRAELHRGGLSRRLGVCALYFRERRPGEALVAAWARSRFVRRHETPDDRKRQLIVLIKDRWRPILDRPVRSVCFNVDAASNTRAFMIHGFKWKLAQLHYPFLVHAEPLDHLMIFGLSKTAV
jgi:hypothetical protein